jgi:hypothetical protein
MQLRRSVATSLVTGDEVEFFEPVTDGLGPITSDPVARLLDDSLREGRLSERRILRRMIFGLRPTVGELELR